MTESWRRRLLFAAAAWSFFGGITALADPAQHFGLMFTTALSLEDPVQSFFYRCTWISVLAWGGVYAFAAVSPESRKGILISGGLGKVAFTFACLQVYQSGAGKPPILFAGGVDLLLAVIFGVILLSGRGAVERAGLRRESDRPVSSSRK